MKPSPVCQALFLPGRNLEKSIGTVLSAVHNSGGLLAAHVVDDLSANNLDIEAFRSLVDSGNLVSWLVSRSPAKVNRKSHVLHQFFSRLFGVPEAERQFIALVFGDLSFSTPWLESAIATLSDENTFNLHQCSVVTPCAIPSDTLVEKRVRVGDSVLDLAAVAPASCWVTTWDFFQRHGWPDANVSPNRFYAASMMKAANERFGYRVDFLAW
jgi:hypothetical protein